MPKPGEHKTVQARILAYAQEIGWTLVSRAEAERRRGFNAAATTPEARARPATPYFGNLLHAKVREFNSKFQEAEGALVGRLLRLTSDIAGNRDFLTYLRNQGKFFEAGENRELDLMVIDYADLEREPAERRNVYEVTEEFAFHNGRHGTREDVVFLINGIPVLVIECKNASNDEASFEDRQTTTAGALEDLLRAIEENLERKRWQAEKGLDDLTSFVFSRLTEAGIAHPDLVSKNISRWFADYPHWRQSEFELRELRKKVTFAIFAEEDDMNKVAAVVDGLFAVLQRSYRA